MTAAPHLAVAVATGLWCGRLVGQLAAAELPSVQLAVQVGTAFIVGTISHLVLDAIPHSDGIYETSLGTTPVLAVELLIIFGLIFWRMDSGGLNFPVIFSAMVGASWLDCVSMTNKALGGVDLFRPVMYFHGLFHASHGAGPLNLIVQVGITIIALKFIR